MSLQAGVARVDISPTYSMHLVGYPYVERMSTGTHDPLYASALYLENNGTAVIAIALDLCYVPHFLTRPWRDEIEAKTGVPASNVMISVTHTHSGPGVSKILVWRDDPSVPPVDEAYVKRLGEAIVQAATEAKNAAVPAKLAVTSGRAEGVGGNRLEKGGLADPEIGLFYVKRADDNSPLALKLIYAMHPTVMHEDSKLVSSDFPYYTRRDVEAALPGCILCYHNGTSGNQSPRYYVNGQTFEEAERLGSLLARNVLDAINQLDDSQFSDSPKLAAAQRFISLPFREIPSVEEADANYKAAIDEYERLKREGAGHGPVRTAECVTFGADFIARMARAQEEGVVDEVRERYKSIEVQLLQIDDAYVSAWPGEYFVEYGVDLKSRAPQKIFPVTMANGDLQGYITTPDSDGYEAKWAFFKPESGHIMVESTLDMMRELS